MSELPIEDILRAAAQRNQQKAPDELWDRVASALPPKSANVRLIRPRRRPLRYVVAASLLLVAISAAVMLTLTERSAPSYADSNLQPRKSRVEFEALEVSPTFPQAFSKAIYEGVNITEGRSGIDALRACVKC